MRWAIALPTLLAAVLWTGAAPAGALAQAPGAPGVHTTWPNADKDGFGTAFGGSRVWFTHERGSLTEVFYPTIDRPDVRWLQLAVGDGRSWTVTERGAKRRFARPGRRAHGLVVPARRAGKHHADGGARSPARALRRVHPGARVRQQAAGGGSGRRPLAGAGLPCGSGGLRGGLAPLP